MTNLQNKAINKINASESYEVTSVNQDNSVSLINVETKDKNFSNKQTLVLTIGTKGGIKVLSASRVFADDKVQQTLASLFGLEVFNRQLTLES